MNVLKLLFAILISTGLGACGSQRQDEAAQFFLKGNEQLQKREYGQAIRYYSESILKKEDFADAYNNRGLAYFRSDRTAQAVADYSKAIQLDAHFLPAYLNRAEARLASGDAEGSLADLQRIGSAYTDSSFYQTRLADTYAALHQPTQAFIAYDKAIRLNPKNVEALINKSSLLYGIRNYKDSESNVDDALKIDPESDAALNNKSLLRLEANQPTEALLYIDKALLVQPAQPYYLNNKARILLRLNRPDEAYTYLKQSLALDEQNASAYLTLSAYYRLKNQPAKAIEAVQKAAQLDSSVYGLDEAKQKLKMR